MCYEVTVHNDHFYHAHQPHSDNRSGQHRIYAWPKRGHEKWTISAVFGLEKVRTNLRRIVEACLLDSGQDPTQCYGHVRRTSEATPAIISFLFVQLFVPAGVKRDD